MNALVSDQPSVLWVLEQKVEKAWAGVRSPINTHVDSFLRAWKEIHPYNKRYKNTSKHMWNVDSFFKKTCFLAEFSLADLGGTPPPSLNGQNPRSSF